MDTTDLLNGYKFSETQLQYTAATEMENDRNTKQNCICGIQINTYYRYGFQLRKNIMLRWKQSRYDMKLLSS